MSWVLKAISTASSETVIPEELSVEEWAGSPVGTASKARNRAERPGVTA